MRISSRWEQTHFLKIVSFEMNIEEKLLVVQVLGYSMRPASVRWQSKPWNRYSLFTEYAESQVIKSVRHMLHVIRFGEFEDRCTVGLYLADCWMTGLRPYAGGRNQLECYLRSKSDVIETCKFLWAGGALVGTHVTTLFLSMQLEHKVTPRKLLDVLPELHKDRVVILLHLRTWINVACQLYKNSFPIRFRNKLPVIE